MPASMISSSHDTRNFRYLLASAIIASAVLLSAAMARAETVTIYNERSDAVQVCVYNALIVLGGDRTDTSSGPPLACWVVEQKKSVRWDRARTFGYRLTVSKPNSGLTICESAAVPMGRALTIGPACQLTAAAPKPAPKPTPAAPKPVKPQPVSPQPAKQEPPKPQPKSQPKRAASDQKPPPSFEDGFSIARAPEDDPRIKIINQMSETVKLCVYKNEPMIIPVVCWNIASRQYVIWDRKGDDSKVIIDFFKPGIIDVPYCGLESSLYFMGNPQQVTIDPGCLLKIQHRASVKPSRPPSGPPLDSKASIRVCNRNTDQTVNFVIAYLVDEAFRHWIFLVEGWFRSDPGKCLDIDLTSRLKASANPIFKLAGEKAFHFALYGETGGILNSTWGGDKLDDPEFCVKKVGNFKYRQSTDKKRECFGSNHEWVKFGVMSNRETVGNVTTFYWNF